MTEWIERFYVQNARSNLFTLMFKFKDIIKGKQSISWKYNISPSYKTNLSAKTVMWWSKINTIFTTVPGITVARNSLIFLAWKETYICLPTPRFEIPRFPFPRRRKAHFLRFHTKRSMLSYISTGTNIRGNDERRYFTYAR